MIERLKKLFEKNKKEIVYVETKEISDGAKKDYQKIFKKNNDLIDEYITENEIIDQNIAKYRQERNENNAEIIDCDIDSFMEEKKDTIKILDRAKQGKIKNIISTIFGQVDKRMHNAVYDNNSKISKSLWKNYKERVKNRYSDLSGYAIKNGIITAILTVINIVGFKVLPNLSGLFNAISAGTACFAGNTIVKIFSTIYNKNKFGGFKLSKHKTLFEGKYLENIKTSIFDYQKAKELTSDTPIEDNLSISIPKNSSMDEYIEEESKRLIEDLELENTNEEDLVNDELSELDVKKPDIRNYGNLGICIDSSDDAMKYSKAISTIRRSNDNDARIEAYVKLANTFGKSKKKKSKNTNISKLNDYARTLKLVSEYGRKVRSPEATKEDTANYIALLYRLGKDFDNDYDIADFLADEYDRYQEDLQKSEEEAKILKKVL